MEVDVELMEKQKLFRKANILKNTAVEMWKDLLPNLEERIEDRKSTFEEILVKRRHMNEFEFAKWQKRQEEEYEGIQTIEDSKRNRPEVDEDASDNKTKVVLSRKMSKRRMSRKMSKRRMSRKCQWPSESRKGGRKVPHRSRSRYHL